mgnify:CR=1 FL=1
MTLFYPDHHPDALKKPLAESCLYACVTGVTETSTPLIHPGSTGSIDALPWPLQRFLKGYFEPSDELKIETIFASDWPLIILHLFDLDQPVKGW